MARKPIEKLRKKKLRDLRVGKGSRPYEVRSPLNGDKPHTVTLGANAEVIVETTERRAMAVALRRRGMTYEEVAEHMGLNSRAQAQKYVYAGLKDIVRPEAEALRDESREKFDQMVAKLRPKVEQGDLQAIDLWRKIEMDKARLFGYIAPEQVSVRAVASSDVVRDFFEAMSDEQFAVQVEEAKRALREKGLMLPAGPVIDAQVVTSKGGDAE